MDPAPEPRPRSFAERVRLLRAATREARAFVRLATLLPRDVGISVPARVDDGGDVVVLVHGSLATAGAWRPLRRRLESAGASVVTFTYGPGSGVREAASAIAVALSGIPAAARVHLVGHSLGGLAVRWYVQELPPDPRVVRTITVAAPFDGARGAWLMPGRAGRDMQRGSVVLERLARSAAGATVPHLSIFGDADTAVARGTRFGVGEHVVVADAGHNTLLFDEGVVGRIVAEVGAPVSPVCSMA